MGGLTDFSRESSGMNCEIDLCRRPAGFLWLLARPDQSRLHLNVTSPPRVRHVSSVSSSSMPHSILAVDDERDVTELIRFHLSRAGYEVLTASSGREAIETIGCCRPDLVLLDLMLPDIDGSGYARSCAATRLRRRFRS